MFLRYPLTISSLSVFLATTIYRKISLSLDDLLSSSEFCDIEGNEKVAKAIIGGECF